MAGRLPIDVFTVIDREDVYDVLLLIDPVEDPELADSVSPCFGAVVPELSDIDPEVRLNAELKIYAFFQLGSDKSLLAGIQTGEGGLKFGRLENPITTQRSAPSSTGRRVVPCEGWH